MQVQYTTREKKEKKGKDKKKKGPQDLGSNPGGPGPEDNIQRIIPSPGVAAGPPGSDPLVVNEVS